MFQDPDDQLFMPTVAQDVAFGPANFGVHGDGAGGAGGARRSTGVAWPSRPTAVPRHLSAGQRRRAALATVLACDPDVLVLDEPSANLDPVARRELAQTLTALDATMLIVTHDLPYAAQLCDRAVVIDGGVIVADGARICDEILAAHRLELPCGFTALEPCRGGIPRAISADRAECACGVSVAARRRPAAARRTTPAARSRSPRAAPDGSSTGRAPRPARADRSSSPG